LFCKECGNELKNAEAKFCARCGAKVERDREEADGSLFKRIQYEVLPFVKLPRYNYLNQEDDPLNLVNSRPVTCHLFIGHKKPLYHTSMPCPFSLPIGHSRMGNGRVECSGELRQRQPSR